MRTKMSFVRSILLSLATTVMFTPFAVAQEGSQKALEIASHKNQFAFLVFYKSNDANTQKMLALLQATLPQTQGAAIVPVQIGNPSDQATIDKFDASRIPTPALVALAPNGAICGAFPQRITKEQIVGSFVTPTQAECLKALQENQIVLLCVHATIDQQVPTGVTKFKLDPLYKDRTKIVSVLADNPEEGKFLEKLKIPQDSKDVLVGFMAPPGAMLGLFDSKVAFEQLAETLASAGQCCEDENCKHNQAAASKAAKR